MHSGKTELSQLASRMPLLIAQTLHHVVMYKGYKRWNGTKLILLTSQ